MRLTLFLAAMVGLLTATASAQAPVPAPPSPVDARYVEPSSSRMLRPDEKIGDLYTLNQARPYVLQRLTERTYWFQRQFYGTTFYVGDRGVLLFDPLEYRAEYILQAIREVTPLPVTAIVYSHNHGDHIGDTPAILEATARSGVTPRIIASAATAELMRTLGSGLPAPAEVIPWPKGSFQFEGLTVELHGFAPGAHSRDHGAWLLVGERVLHAPDHINPDQPPFWEFAGSETFAFYEQNLRQTEALDWVFVNGGHGNVGSRGDYRFYFRYIEDLKRAVRGAMQTTTFGAGIDPASVNAHTVYLTSWLEEIARKVTDELRPTYGRFYGYDRAAPTHAKMVTMYLYSYR